MRPNRVTAIGVLWICFCVLTLLSASFNAVMVAFVPTTNATIDYSFASTEPHDVDEPPVMTTSQRLMKYPPYLQIPMAIIGLAAAIGLLRLRSWGRVVLSVLSVLVPVGFGVYSYYFALGWGYDPFFLATMIVGGAIMIAPFVVSFILLQTAVVRDAMLSPA